MIRFILTADHSYTIQGLSRMGVPLPPCEGMTYDHLFETTTVPTGSYVFCDLERLSDLELYVAAAIYAELKAKGLRVFNDPAAARMRYGLLRALLEAGLNSFDVHRAEGCPRPTRFPVFIRGESDHNQPTTSLIPDQTTLDTVLARLVAGGRPLRGLLVVEFCGEPYAPSIWRRYGAFRFGDHVHLDNVATESHWAVKVGRPGLVGDETYAADDALIRANGHAETIGRAFAIAGIEYGRADFGLVGGQPQIYEINTNPHLAHVMNHPSPIRMRTLAFARERFGRLFATMDSPDHGARVTLETRLAVEHRANLNRRNRRYFDLGRNAEAALS